MDKIIGKLLTGFFVAFLVLLFIIEEIKIGVFWSILTSVWFWAIILGVIVVCFLYAFGGAIISLLVTISIVGLAVYWIILLGYSFLGMLGGILGGALGIYVLIWVWNAMRFEQFKKLWEKTHE